MSFDQRNSDPNDNGIFGGNDSTAPASVGAKGNGVFGFSNVPNASGVFGANNNGGVGVSANSDNGDGMDARTASSARSGIFARNDATTAAPAGTPGGNGVFGLSTVPNASGVFGANNNGGTGVAGVAHGNGDGVAGFSENGAGVIGRSAKNGVVGQTQSDSDAGVNGRNDGNGFGVFGGSLGGSGVEGHSTNGTGVVGFSDNGLAGRFIGDVEVTGTVFARDFKFEGADFAEDFSIGSAEVIEPGTVMVIDREGALQRSQLAYDKRVAGVISGAGDLRPGIVLDKQRSQGNRMPLALVGKAYCQVDAEYAPVEVGDLLTTSPTPGFAMKAGEPIKAFGAVIGKALRRLESGQGMIPILIALQ